MGDKKVHKGCRIFQWIEATDGPLADAIRDLCMEGVFAGGRRGGVTFLYPSAATREEIVQKAGSPDAETAVRLLEAHIVPEIAIHSAADFGRAGSRLGIKLEVETVVKDTVTLRGGARLKPAPTYNPPRRDNSAVWLVESGSPPLEGPAAEPSRRSDRRRAGGDAESSRVQQPSWEVSGSRAALATRVENEFDACMRKDRCRARDPYLAHAVSLLNFLKISLPALLEGLVPVIDRDPAVTFYLLVEPYKTRGKHLIPEDVLVGSQGWNGADIFEGAVSEFEGFFDSLDQRREGDAPLMFREAAAVRSATDAVRLQIVGDDGRLSNIVRTPKAVHQAYEVLVSRNAIGGTGPILPAETLRLLPGDKKLWQDELRFLLHAALEELRREPWYAPASFAEIQWMLRHHRPGNDYPHEAALSNAEQLQRNVAPRAEFSLLIKFINSTDFLYVPVSSAKIGGAWGDIPVAQGSAAFLDPTDLSVYNTEASKHRLLEGMRARGLDVPTPLDAGHLAALRHYVSLHGSLPPNLGLEQAAPATSP